MLHDLRIAFFPTPRARRQVKPEFLAVLFHNAVMLHDLKTAFLPDPKNVDPRCIDKSLCLLQH